MEAASNDYNTQLYEPTSAEYRAAPAPQTTQAQAEPTISQKPETSYWSSIFSKEARGSQAEGNEGFSASAALSKRNKAFDSQKKLTDSSEESFTSLDSIVQRILSKRETVAIFVAILSAVVLLLVRPSIVMVENESKQKNVSFLRVLVYSCILASLSWGISSWK